MKHLFIMLIMFKKEKIKKIKKRKTKKIFLVNLIFYVDEDTKY